MDTISKWQVDCSDTRPPTQCTTIQTNKYRLSAWHSFRCDIFDGEQKLILNKNPNKCILIIQHKMKLQQLNGVQMNKKKKKKKVNTVFIITADKSPYGKLH